MQQLFLDAINRGGVRLRRTHGFYGFGHRLEFVGDDDCCIGSVSYGGKQSPRVMLEVKGAATPTVVELLRQRHPLHSVTRVDSCADFDAPEAFEELCEAVTTVKKQYRLIGSKAGDWDDFPEYGRTLYVGSKSSVCRVRLYEKGKQPEYRHLKTPNWVRLEVQVRPKNKAAKEAFSRLSAADVWGASGWTRELSECALSVSVERQKAGTVYKQSEQERALEWMCKQYRKTLTRLHHSVGNWECVGLTLGEIINRQHQHQHQH